MTEEEQRRETVLRKLRRTGRGETVCLADWEVKLLLGYIDDMKRKAGEIESEKCSKRKGIG